MSTEPVALRLAKGLRDGTLLLSERDEAAEVLERLHAENEALRERAGFLTGMTREAQQFAQICGDEVLTLRFGRSADLEAMRMAVEAITAIADQMERVGDTRPHKDGQYIDDARAALAALRVRVGE